MSPSQLSLHSSRVLLARAALKKWDEQCHRSGVQLIEGEFCVGHGFVCCVRCGGCHPSNSRAIAVTDTLLIGLPHSPASMMAVILVVGPAGQ